MTALLYGSFKAIPKVLKFGKEALNKIVETRLAAKDILVLRKNEKDAKKLVQLCDNELSNYSYQFDLFPEEEEKWIEEMREGWIGNKRGGIEKYTRGGQLEFKFNERNEDPNLVKKKEEPEDGQEVVPKNLKLHRIPKPQNGDSNAIILQSDFELRKSPRLGGVVKYKKELMWLFGLKGLRVFVIANATREDLMVAIQNRDIDHIAVDGHGTWGSWIDSEGAKVTNQDFKYTKIEKKSFARHTCGHPGKNSHYDDQLGKPVAEYVFGNSKIQTNWDISINPLPSSSAKAFKDSKAMTSEKNSTLSAKFVDMRNAILNSFLEDIGFQKKK